MKLPGAERTHLMYLLWPELHAAFARHSACCSSSAKGTGAAVVDPVIAPVDPIDSKGVACRFRTPSQYERTAWPCRAWTYSAKGMAPCSACAWVSTGGTLGPGATEASAPHLAV